MTKKFKIATLALSACMALGVVGFTACGQAGKSAYDIWLEQGNTGTEQDFLDSLKGAAGTPGTPGNPGTPGSEGKSAYQVWLELGNTGTEQDFLDSLKGEPGDPGDPGDPGAAGARGNKITRGEGEPHAAGAIEGDMYVDTTNWHVYFFESGAWNDYGSIKGEGVASEEPKKEVLIKNFDEVTLSGGQSTELDFNGVSAGTYYLVAETDSAAKADTLYLKDPIVHDNSGIKYEYDMYNPANGGEYRCVVYLKTDGTGTSGGLLSNKSGEEIKLKNVRLIEFDLVIEAGKEVVVPAFFGNMTRGKVQIPISKDLVGKNVKLTVWSNKRKIGNGPNINVEKLGHDAFSWSAEDQVETGVWVKTYELSASEEFIIFNGQFVNANYEEKHINIKIKIELA